MVNRGWLWGAMVLATTLSLHGAEVIFKPVKIDGPVHVPETDDNSEFAMDVNFDGKTDIVSSGWMFLKGAFWYENPGKKGVVWKSTRIHQALNMEGVIHGDIDGDGDDA